MTNRLLTEEELREAEKPLFTGSTLLVDYLSIIHAWLEAQDAKSLRIREPEIRAEVRAATLKEVGEWLVGKVCGYCDYTGGIREDEIQELIKGNWPVKSGRMPEEK